MLGARLVAAELVPSNFAELLPNRRREQEQEGGFNPQNQQHKHRGFTSPGHLRMHFSAGLLASTAPNPLATGIAHLTGSD